MRGAAQVAGQRLLTHALLPLRVDRRDVLRLEAVEDALIEVHVIHIVLNGQVPGGPW